MLDLPEGESVFFSAGQYLEIELPSRMCPFSIASAPELTRQLELHVRPTPNSEDSRQIETLLDTATEVVIEIPKGDCFIDAPPVNSLVLIAASTGVTQMKSIIEHLLPQGHRLPIHLYWGVLSANDLYLNERCKQLEAQYPNFHYVPVVSEPATSPGWQGRTGLVGEVALRDMQDVRDITAIVSGGPAMVYATLDAFVERGMPEANMHSDIFSYAPRPR